MSLNCYISVSVLYTYLYVLLFVLYVSVWVVWYFHLQSFDCIFSVSCFWVHHLYIRLHYSIQYLVTSKVIVSYTLFICRQKIILVIRLWISNNTLSSSFIHAICVIKSLYHPTKSLYWSCNRMQTVWKLTKL